MRPKLSQPHQSNGVSAAAAAGNGNSQHATNNNLPISQSLTSFASTSTAHGPTRSASTGIVNPVFLSDLVDNEPHSSNVNIQHHQPPPTRPSIPHPPVPPPTKPKPTKQPLIQSNHKPRSASSGSSENDGVSSGDSTIETTASDNRRTLTTSSVEIEQHSHHSNIR